jgi:hypothetical protein
VHRQVQCFTRFSTLFGQDRDRVCTGHANARRIPLNRPAHVVKHSHARSAGSCCLWASGTEAPGQGKFAHLLETSLQEGRYGK